MTASTMENNKGNNNYQWLLFFCFEIITKNGDAFKNAPSERECNSTLHLYPPSIYSYKRIGNVLSSRI